LQPSPAAFPDAGGRQGKQHEDIAFSNCDPFFLAKSTGQQTKNRASRLQPVYLASPSGAAAYEKRRKVTGIDTAEGAVDPP